MPLADWRTPTCSGPAPAGRNCICSAPLIYSSPAWIFSLPPCGGGPGWGVGTWRVAQSQPPTLALPRKGEGNKTLAASIVVFLPPGLWGRAGVGGTQSSALSTQYSVPPTLTLPRKGGGNKTLAASIVVFLPPGLWGRAGVGEIAARDRRSASVCCAHSSADTACGICRGCSRSRPPASSTVRTHRREEA